MTKSGNMPVFKKDKMKSNYIVFEMSFNSEFRCILIFKIIAG